MQLRIIEMYRNFCISSYKVLRSDIFSARFLLKTKRKWIFIAEVT